MWLTRDRILCNLKGKVKSIKTALSKIAMALAAYTFLACSSVAPSTAADPTPTASNPTATDKFIDQMTKDISKYDSIEAQSLEFSDFHKLMQSYLSRGLALLRNHENEKAFFDFMKVKTCAIEQSGLYKDITYSPAMSQAEQQVFSQQIQLRNLNSTLQNKAALCLSWIHAAKGDFLSALNEIDTAAPDYMGGYYHSKYLFFLGEHEKAAEYLENFLSSGNGLVDGMLVSTGSIGYSEDNDAEAWKVLNDIFMRARGKNPYFFIKKAYRMQIRGKGVYEPPFAKSVNLQNYLKGNILPSGKYTVINEGSSQVHITQYTADGYWYTTSKNPDVTINDQFDFVGGKIYVLTEQEIIEFSSFEEFERH